MNITNGSLLAAMLSTNDDGPTTYICLRTGAVCGSTIWQQQYPCNCAVCFSYYQVVTTLQKIESIDEARQMIKVLLADVTPGNKTPKTAAGPAQ